MTASTIITALREISEIITQSNGDSETLAEKIGTIREKIFTQYEVTPKFDGIESASIVPQPTGTEIGHVNLTLSEGIAISELQTAFGDYNQTPPMPNTPPEGQFRFNTSSKSHSITLIAPLDSDSTTTLTIRRDMIP